MDCLIRYDFTKSLRVSSLKNSFYFDLLTRHDVLIERKRTFARFVRRNFMRRRANERFVSVDGTRRIEKSHVQLVTREQRVRFHAENQAHPSFLSTNRVRDLLVGFDSRLIRNVFLSLSLRSFSLNSYSPDGFLTTRQTNKFRVTIGFSRSRLFPRREKVSGKRTTEPFFIVRWEIARQRFVFVSEIRSNIFACSVVAIRSR